ncbi:MAG TPA: cytochrome c, partial [Caldimonas sp.]|nr:cytochrome c [Caldimonas sp.]
EMGEVVAFSTSQMNDADLAALVAYLGDRPPSPDAQVAPPANAVMQQGKAIWEDECSACHRMDGAGAPRYFPPVKGSANLQQTNATTVLHYILAGAHRAATDRAPTPFAMPGFYWKLDDEQIAAVATYARNSWGNEAAPVAAEDVAKLRAKLEFGPSRTEAAEAKSTPMTHPGPNTDAPADTLSSDNGTPAAGRAAPAAQAAASTPESGSSAVPSAPATPATTESGSSAAAAGDGAAEPAGTPAASGPH